MLEISFKSRVPKLYYNLPKVTEQDFWFWVVTVNSKFPKRNLISCRNAFYYIIEKKNPDISLP